MSGRYERVNNRDDDEPDTPVARGSRQSQQHVPNSPPPSFHSRSSSLSSRPHQVDSTLADAFDDDSDDEADDTQRLVRGPASPTASSPPTSTAPSTAPPPTTYRAPPPPSGATPMRVYGGGIQSDGVFSNLNAKPETGEVKEEQPPTYEQAAADAAPPYWETTILAPGYGGVDDVFIDGMPVGSFFSFFWNMIISISFQPLIGFLLTYLLHSTHAAKNGSKVGLGVSLIQYGFSLRSTGDPNAGAMGGQAGATSDGYANPPDPNSHDFDPNTVTNGNGGESGQGDMGGFEWFTYILMIVGWFIIIRSLSDFLKAKRHEHLVLQAPDRGLGVPIIAENENPERVV